MPHNTFVSSGILTRPAGFKYPETGYEFQKHGGEKIIVHCGPSPSWDFCLDGVGTNKNTLGSVSLEYYIEHTGNGSGTVIVSVVKGKTVTVSADSQLKMWINYTKYYNSRMGGYVAQPMDASYWLIHLIPISLVLLSTWTIASYLSRRLKKGPA